MCRCCSLIHSVLFRQVRSGGVRSLLRICSVNKASSISGVTRSLTYTCLYVPSMLILWISHVRFGVRNAILCVSSTSLRTSVSTCPLGSTHMRSTKSLGIKHAKGLSCRSATLSCRQILSAGGAHMPKVYLSLGILLSDSES